MPVFTGCLALALVGAAFKVRVPGIAGTLSPSCVPILFAVGTMTWQETVVIALLAAFVQCLWRAQRRPTLLQIAFNAAALSLSSGIAYAVSHSLAARAPLVLFAAAALVYQVANAAAVATILCLLEGGPLSSVWRNCHLWSFPYHLAGGAVALVWAQAAMPAGVSVSVLVALTLYLMKTFYGEIVARSTRTAHLA